jgi:hypothetical protein
MIGTKVFISSDKRLASNWGASAALANKGMASAIALAIRVFVGSIPRSGNRSMVAVGSIVPGMTFGLVWLNA